MPSVARAYLLQAQADYASYQLLKREGQPLSQQLHLLQMTTEKAGKAFLAAAHRMTLDDLSKSHVAFSRLVGLLPRNRTFQQLSNVSGEQLRQHLATLRPLIHQIERLAPDLAKRGPNAEYPWQDPAGEVHVPCQHRFPLLIGLLETSKGRGFLKILERVLSKEELQRAFGM